MFIRTLVKYSDLLPYQVAEQISLERIIHKDRFVKDIMHAELTCAWHGALAELLAVAGEPEAIKHPPLPDGRAPPTRHGQFSEMGRPKEA
jgi:hypothetical protein